MAAKKRPKTAPVFTSDKIGSYLKTKMAEAKLDVNGYAKKLGVHTQSIYMVASGSRAPSKEFLEKVGLETGYRMPGSSVVFSLADLQMFVVMKLLDSKLNTTDYAAKIGIHEQTLYKIVAGVRPVPKPLIKQYGLELVYRII